MPWRSIGRLVGYSHELVRKRIDPEFAADTARHKRTHYQAAPSKIDGQVHPPEATVMVPPAVSRMRALMNRARATMAPMAILMGDPPPGFSAAYRDRGIFA